MKKLFLAIMALLAASATTASAETNFGIFNHLGVGAHVATTGYGFEVGLPVTPFFQIRGGIDFMPDFSFKTDVDGSVYAAGMNHNVNVDLDLGMKRTQTSVLVNLYPFPSGGFFIAGGMYFGGHDVLSIHAHSDEVAQLASSGYLEVGEYNLPIDAQGNAEGMVRVKKTRPYVGIGFGRPVPKSRLNVMFEMGVQFHAKPELYHLENGEYVRLNEIPGLDPDNTMSKIMDKATVYPVIKLSLTGRIF